MTTTTQVDPDANDRSTARRGLILVAVAVLAYSVVHVGFRLLASGVLGEDDVIDNILAQDLRPGYAGFPRQPPIYDWVLWAVQQFTGPTLSSFLLIKYAALIAAACFIYLSAYRILNDRLYAVLCVESLALIYQISWRFHEGFTHEVGAMVAVCATLLAFLRVVQQPSAFNFLLAGGVAGLGLLTEPMYGVYLAALLVAAALQPSLRARIYDLRLGLSAAMALIVASPYLYWLAFEAPVGSLNFQLFPDVKRILIGLKDALRGPIAYLSPLLFIVPLLFPGSASTAWQDLRTPPNTTATTDLEQWVLHTGLIGLALSAAGALLFGVYGLAIHALMPLYVTSVIWLMGVARRATDAHSTYVGRFTRVALAIAVIALVARLANMFILDPVCKTCRWGIPYAAFAEEIRERGFRSGTIVSLEHELAGNLRQLFPDTPVVTRRYPKFTPEAADLTRGQVVYVWDDSFSDAYSARYLKGLLPKHRATSEAARVTVPWSHLWRPAGYRMTSWRLMIVDMDRGGELVTPKN